jgi:hypothetical protein
LAALFRRSLVPSVPINWIVFKEKTVVVSYGFLLFYEPYWIEEICDTPAEYLASQDPTAACGEEGQTVGGKGADFRNQAGMTFKKNCR